MANIIYSAYFCEVNGGSESYTAVEWLKILLKEHSVYLFTSKNSSQSLINYYGKLPDNLKIHSFDIPYWIEKKRNIQFHQGYFVFDHKLVRYLRVKSDIIEWSDVILKKTPSSYRYYSRLYIFDKPFVIGPLGGGLQVPKALKGYFKNEPLLNKLRVLDKLLFYIHPFQNQLKRADRILITLDYLRDIIPPQYANKLRTIFDTGIEIPDVTISPKSTDSQIRLLYVGKLIRYKGAELLIKALKRQTESFDYLLDIIGDGLERDYLEQMVRRLGLTNRIKFHGNIPKQKVMDFYISADIFCFPTLTEASGNVLLEAMAYQLPIITINNGGPKHMCPNNGAIKIDIDNVEIMIDELSKAIFQLSISKEKRLQMGRVNRRHVMDNFSWDVLGKKINAFFHRYD